MPGNRAAGDPTEAGGEDTLDAGDTRPDGVTPVGGTPVFPSALSEADESDATAPGGEGLMIDHFRVIRRVGRGSMGEVFLARDLRLGRKVALKLISTERLGSQQAAARFLLEARMTAKFSHPHIVGIHAVGEFAGSPYVALEYLDGQNLAERIDRDRPGRQEALRVALAVASALAEAHAHGVLHRDLKPANILMPKDGRTRVVDFGLAKFADVKEEIEPELTVDEAAEDLRDSLRTRERVAKGTPAYMAPEQWMALPLSPATDIWALGVILFEMISGRRPFQHLERETVAHAQAVCMGEPPPRLDTIAEAPPPLADLTARCLDRDAAKRPTAREVERELTQMLARPVASIPDEEGPFRGLLPFQQRHADFFFGRDAEIAAFLERVREEPVLPIVGASGTGKTSFIQAGIIPRLVERSPWTVVQIRPGDRPFHALAAALVFRGGAATAGASSGTSSAPAIASVSSREAVAFDDAEVNTLAEQLRAQPWTLALQLAKISAAEHRSVLLFIDQLEEVYTLSDDEQSQRAFIRAIASASDDPIDPVRVIFAIRDDFLSRLARAGTEVRNVLRQVTVLQSPDRDALRETLVRPAEAAGYGYDDPAIVEGMIDAVSGDAAGLPLLQFTARLLWERRDAQHELLLASAYREIGGVAGALATHADGLLAGMTASDVRLAREILLRLVTPERTRRTVFAHKLVEGLGAAGQDVLTRLLSARLVTLRKQRGASDAEAQVELAHESLIARWRQLRQWLDACNAELAFIEEASRAAELWERRGMRAEEAWTGGALQEALRKLERRTTEVPPQVRRFLIASRKLEARRTQKKRASLLVVVLVLSTIAGVLARQNRVVELERRRAELESAEARRKRAEALREGARASLEAGSVLEARAKLRGALEEEDSAESRFLWRRLAGDPRLWRRMMSADVFDLAVSPDGATVAAPCADHAVYLVDAVTSTVRVLRGADEQVLSAAFSGDGKWLAAGARSGRIFLWDVARPELTRVLEGHASSVWSLAFAGERLASGGADGTARLWDVAGGSQVGLHDGGDHGAVHEGEVFSVAFSPAGDRLVTAARDGLVRIFSVKDGALTATLRGHQGAVHSAFFSPDGTRIGSAGDDRALTIWPAADGGAPILRLTGHTGTIWAAAFSPDGRRIASGSADGTIRVWSAVTGALEDALEGHEGSIWDLRFVLDGRRIVSSSRDLSVRMWKLDARPVDTRREPHASGVMSLAFDPRGARVASGGRDETVRIWDVGTGVLRAAIDRYPGVVTSLAFDPRGDTLATVHERVVRVFDLSSGELSWAGAAFPETINVIQFAPDGGTIAAVGDDGALRVIDAKSGAVVKTIVAGAGRVTALAYSRDGRRAATAGLDRLIHLWDAASWKPGAILRGHAAAIGGLEFDPTGRFLVSGSDDGTVRLWEIATSGSERAVGRHGARVSGVSFSPDGTRVASASADGAARIWDLETGRAVRLQGHGSEVNAVIFSPDGKLLATGTAGGTVRLWYADTGRPFWGAPIALSSPAQVLTHRGWATLDGAIPVLFDGAKWLERAKTAQLTEAAADGKTLCILPGDSPDSLEIWDIASDRTLFSTVVGEIQDMAAGLDRCAIRTLGSVTIFDRAGVRTELDTGAEPTAFTIAGGNVFVAAGAIVFAFDESGTKTAEYPADVGVTSLALIGDSLALGYAEGGLEIIPLDRTRPVGPRRTFDGTPASAVMHIVPGPMDTLFAGFANGVVGAWRTNTGDRLEQAQLHGPIRLLTVRNQRLHALSDLGRYLIWELELLHRPYCDLLREVWREVPYLWETGLATLEPPQHRCKE